MISVKVKNPELILVPITGGERLVSEKEFLGDENLYVLYKLPSSGNINIGMMSPSVGKYCPAVANVWRLGEAVSWAFFYNGGSELEKDANSVTDRPVYRIIPTEERVVSECQILNGNSENGLEVMLDDIVDGSYTVCTDKPAVLKK